MRFSDLQGQFADHRPPANPTVDELAPVAHGVFAWLNGFDDPDFPTRAPHRVPPPHGRAHAPAWCHVQAGADLHSPGATGDTF